MNFPSLRGMFKSALLVPTVLLLATLIVLVNVMMSSGVAAS
ncbi:hypothetical protein SAMN04488037_101233 [Shimia marina]|uniref:Uncharacterized protein n=1 Tax=Shimia marina TaxID=321267 RepID=A0A0N7LRQ0_9RHOB|nr:hypothetical protein SHM7688_00873 [Shimia marina]SFD49239.1 hypothetical protein SAMN04488037_101233 [Shimia marina]